MTDKLNVVVAGCTGLGNVVARAVIKHPNATLCGVHWLPQEQGMHTPYGWAPVDPAVCQVLENSRTRYFSSPRSVLSEYQSIYNQWREQFRDEEQPPPERPDLIIYCWRPDGDGIEIPLVEYPSKYFLGIHPTPLRFGMGHGSTPLQNVLMEMYENEVEELPFWENSIFMATDKGPTAILAHQSFQITYRDNLKTLLDKVNYTTATMLPNVLQSIAEGSPTLINIVREEGSPRVLQYPVLAENYGHITRYDKVYPALGKIRAMSPPASGAYFQSYYGVKLYVYDAFVREITHIRKTGYITEVSPENGMVVKFGDGELCCTRIGTAKHHFWADEFVKLCDPDLCGIRVGTNIYNSNIIIPSELQ